MNRFRRRPEAAVPGHAIPRVGPGLAALIAVAVGVSSCEGDLLEVDDSSIIVPADLDEAGAAAIPTLSNGVVGAYQEALDGLIRYSALLTDEMVLAGTFPTRFQVDARRIPVVNADLTEDVYEPLHRARFQADTVAFLFEERLEDPEFEEATGLLLEGIALAKLYGGFTRLWLAELYCWSILTGMYPESSPVLSDDRLADALVVLQEAEQVAETIGLVPVQAAAIVGQARSRLWLGDFDEAAALASRIAPGFVYRAEYSANEPDQYNEMYSFTWGDTQPIRWTVGDGTAASTAGERWPHLDEFLSLNLLRNRPSGFVALNQSIPVVLQMLYSEPSSDVLMASGAEAALIQAEVAVRNGNTGFAESLLNDLRSDYSLRATLEWDVDPAPAGLLPDLQLSGDLETDLRTVVDERARELWLTGDRHTTARRLRLDPQFEIDLFPVKTPIGGGDDIAFPIVQREIDNNPNLSGGDACPAGQSPGSWR